MSQIDSLLTIAPTTDGARPELPASGETGGETAFTQLLQSARSVTATAPATDGPPPETAVLAELFRQVPAVDGKDLPPLSTEGMPAVAGVDDADKLPDAMAPDAATPASMSAIAALIPLTPPIPVAPATPAETGISAETVSSAATDEAAEAAIEMSAKQPMSAALPQGVALKQSPGGKFAAAAIEAAAQQPSGTDRQTAVSPLPMPAAESMAAVERAVRAPASPDAPVSLQTPVDAVRQLASAMPDTAARMPSSASAPIPVPPDHPQWGQTFGERVVWLVNQHATSAQLSLNPPDLGRLDVQINLDQDQARVLFATPHESVREAIEAAVPRLREMLADTGVQLLDVGIERHAGGRQPHPFQAPPQPFDRSNPAPGPAADTPAARPGVAIGLVDYFI